MRQAESVPDSRLSRRRGVFRICAAIVALLLSAWARAEAPPDAVIELWEQHWSLADDGTITYHHRQHVRLNNERAYGEFADPRITFDAAVDELNILVARVQRPDGSYRELPPYAHVLVTPDATAGWPVLATIRQHLLVMSGIEPGCLVELEYRITSPPGSRPTFAADVRLDHRYPVKNRSVAVTAPASAHVEPVLILPDGVTPTTSTEGNARIWRFENLPPASAEPQTPPWQITGPRFAFSSARTVDSWLQTALAAIENAADQSGQIEELAARWTEQELDAQEKFRAIQQRLSATFNFVPCDPDLWPALPRPASQTLRENHGTPEEAAALLIALARAAGLRVQPAVLINDETWLQAAPQRSAVAGYAVLLDMDGELYPCHPQFGGIARSRRWAGHSLLTLDGDGTRRLTFAPWTDPDESGALVDVVLSVARDGTCAGQAEVRLTGLFVDAEELRGADAQKSRLKSILSHVLPDLSVESFNISRLNDEEFAASLTIKSSRALRERHGRRWIELAEDPPFMTAVSLPLAAATRQAPVRLAGAFSETVAVTVELPDGWSVELEPTELSGAGAWGRFSQRVEERDGKLIISRQIRVDSRDLAPQVFLELRNAVNLLRTAAARTVVLKP